MKNFHLTIMSSERDYYHGECSSLVIATEAGEYGILADHESMVIGIIVGEVKYKIGDKWHHAITGTGFARSTNNQVTILVDTVEKPEEVDVNRALAAKHRAEERMMLKKSKEEYYRGKLAMTRAMVRLKVKEKKYL